MLTNAGSPGGPTAPRPRSLVAYTGTPMAPRVLSLAPRPEVFCPCAPVEGIDATDLTVDMQALVNWVKSKRHRGIPWRLAAANRGMEKLALLCLETELVQPATLKPLWPPIPSSADAYRRHPQLDVRGHGYALIAWCRAVHFVCTRAKCSAAQKKRLCKLALGAAAPAHKNIRAASWWLDHRLCKAEARLVRLCA